MHSPGLNSLWHRHGMVVPGCNVSTSKAEQKFKVSLNYIVNSKPDWDTGDHD